MILKCPSCGQEAEWEGYPTDPKLSTVVCLRCGHGAPGAAFPRVKPESGQDRHMGFVWEKPSAGA